jgi:hypothetical protein
MILNKSLLRVRSALFVLLGTTAWLGLPRILPAQQAGAGVTGAPAAHEMMVRKLKTIVIDKVDFDKMDIATVLQFLSKKSKELDPDKVGINFVLADLTGKHGIHREVTIKLDAVPLADLLGYITQQTNVNCSIEDYAVVFKP